MNVKHRAVATVPVTEPVEPALVDAEYVGPEPVDDGLAAELVRARPRRWWNRVTPWLAAALLLVAGFAGGAQIQKTYGPDAGAGGTANRGGQFGGRTGQFPGNAGQGNAGQGNAGQGNAGQGNAGQGNAGPGTDGASAAPGTGVGRSGSATSGTVKLVDGSTIYVQTDSGEVVTVRTNSGTAVQVPGKLGDLKPGDKVSVQGDPAGDGELTASSVAGRR